MSQVPEPRDGIATQSRLRLFWSRRENAILWVLAAVAGVLGYVGIREHRAALGRPTDAMDMAYHLIQLFLFRTGLGVESHAVPWTLGVARLLAPAVLGYAALKGLASVFRDQLAGARLCFLRKHVVVCGLGDKGLQLVRDLRARRMNVVVIESDKENRELTTVRALGAVVVTGNATDELTLRKARTQHASRLFAFTGDDGINVEIVLAAHRLFAKGPRRGSPLRCFVHLYDTNFASVVRHHPGFAKSQTGMTINVVRTNSICARTLFQEFPLDAPADRFLPPHLIIAGFGNMGESIAIQAAHIGQYASGRLRITVVDMKAPYTESLFLATYPAFREAADIEFVEGDIQSGRFFEMVQGWANEPGYRTTLVISIHDDTKAFACAHHCINRTPGSDMPVHVRLDTNKGFASLLRGEGQASDQKLRRIHPFGMLDDCCTLDKIEGAAIDQLGLIIHEEFLKSDPEPETPGSTTPPDPARFPWEKLEEKFRESNRCQADHIEVKLRAIGCTSGAKDPLKASHQVTVFSPAEIDLLAQMEHTRWYAERRLAGWKYGEKADKNNLISPHLVSWEKLSPETRQKDVNAVTIIPKLLNNMGKWIYRQP